MTNPSRAGSWEELAGLSRRINQAESPQQMAAQVIDCLLGLLPDLDLVLVSLGEGQEHEPRLPIVAAAGHESARLEQAFIDLKDGSLPAAAIGRRQPIKWSLAAPDPAGQPLTQGSRTALSIPLSDGEHSWGVLHLESLSADGLGEQQAALVRLIAEQLSVALHNHQLTSEVKRERERRQAMANISNVLNETLELHAVFSMIVDAARLFIPHVEQAVIHLLEEEQGEQFLRPVALSPRPVSGNRQPESTVRMRPGHGIAGLVLQRGTFINIGDVRADPRFVPNRKDEEFRSILVCPLQSRGRKLGTISVQSPAPAAFQHEAEMLMIELAVEAAIAIEKAGQFEALKTERRRQDAILRNMADGILVVNAAGIVELVNPAMAEIAGQPAEQLIGSALFDLPGGSTLQVIFEEALKKPGATVQRDYVPSPGVFLSASVGVIPGDKEQHVGLVAAVRDVTREREVDRMKTDFISTVSHELRTPLTSILGFVKLIRRNLQGKILPHLPDEDELAQQTQQRVLENLDIIEAEGKRLTNLINEVLDIAKMESGNIDWHMSEIDLQSIVDKAVIATTVLLEHKPLTFTMNMGEGPKIVRADGDRCLQVVTNLISNAVKFTDEGEITVSVHRIEDGVLPEPRGETYARPANLAGDWVLTQVVDSGIGIEKIDLPMVFQRFKQVGDALTDRPRGTGLGLPICREIVEHHSGYIWVESLPGKGSCFSFVLPASDTKALPQPAPEDLAPAAALDKEAKRLILVVDDEEFTRRLLLQMLEDAGYQVITAADGNEAIKLARDQRPDLIILDVMMPQLDGFDTLVVLKNDPQTDGIPVMFLSVLERQQRGLRLGAAAYITKPFEASRLLETVNALVSVSGKEPAAGRHVLIIEANNLTRASVRSVLETRGFQVWDVATMQAGLQVVGHRSPDLVIVGLKVMEVATPQLLANMRRWAEQKPVHFLVMDLEQEDIVESTLETGRIQHLADDVLENLGTEDDVG